MKITITEQEAQGLKEYSLQTIRNEQRKIVVPPRQAADLLYFEEPAAFYRDTAGYPYPVYEVDGVLIAAESPNMTNTLEMAELTQANEAANALHKKEEVRQALKAFIRACLKQNQQADG